MQRLGWEGIKMVGFTDREFKTSLDSYSPSVNRERWRRNAGSHTVIARDTFWIRQQVLGWINNWLISRKLSRKRIHTT